MPTGIVQDIFVYPVASQHDELKPTNVDKGMTIVSLAGNNPLTATDVWYLALGDLVSNLPYIRIKASQLGMLCVYGVFTCNNQTFNYSESYLPTDLLISSRCTLCGLP